MEKIMCSRIFFRPQQNVRKPNHLWEVNDSIISTPRIFLDIQRNILDRHGEKEFCS
jgi:hypothetical protein